MKAKQFMTRIIVSMVWALALTAPVAAQQPATPKGGEEKMSMDDMRKECRTHCQATTTSLDRLTKRIDEAKQSNDPAQMRAALDEAQKPLAEMKNHMTMCMNMMSMMQHTHGGIGGHMGGMMQEKGAESDAESR
jgi:hypothetical protein